jgi:hypothetical protein
MRPSPLVLITATFALVGCSKSPGEQVEAGPTPPSGLVEPVGGDASAPVSTITGSVPTGGTSKDAAAAATADVPPPEPKDAVLDASAAAGECGEKPHPDCPLQAWMKANATPPVSANDLPALAQAFDRMAAFAPAPYPNWASIAKDGASAARAGDMPAAKAACRGCQDQYKKKYKTEMRARKL